MDAIMAGVLLKIKFCFFVEKERKVCTIKIRSTKSGEFKLAARIGDWMIVEGILNSKEVELIVDRQHKGDSRLFGEIALAHAYITPFDLQRFLSFHGDKVEKK